MLKIISWGSSIACIVLISVTIFLWKDRALLQGQVATLTESVRVLELSRKADALAIEERDKLSEAVRNETAKKYTELNKIAENSDSLDDVAFLDALRRMFYDGNEDATGVSSGANAEAGSNAGNSERADAKP